MIFKTLSESENIDPLERIQALAIEAGLPAVAEEAQALKRRVAEGRFYVACVGQFKRGKSTLLNAILGKAILPSGVTPVTAAVTVIRYGKEPSIRIKLQDAGWETVGFSDLYEWVTEEHNPENRKNVEVVEIFHPLPLLAKGMCLVDTPGIGSVFAGNTNTTQAFIPHIDAALVVIGADPPLSGEELNLIEELAAKVPRLLFALNKADRLSKSDRDEAVGFTKRILCQHLNRSEIQVFQVSAIEHLQSNDSSFDWPEFESALTDLAHGTADEVLLAAEQRGIVRLKTRLHKHFDELTTALTRPIEESEARVKELGRCITDAEQAMTELSYLFQAEQDRIARILNREGEDFFHQAYAKASTELKALPELKEKYNNAPVRDVVMESARNIAEYHVRQWMNIMKTKAEVMYLDATARFVRHANEFLRRLEASGTFPPDSLPSEMPQESAIRARSEFYFHSFMTRASSSPFAWIWNRLRPAGSARKAALKDGLEYLRWLMYANTSRVVGDINRRILESRRQLEYLIRLQLREVSLSAEHGLTLANEMRQSGEAAIKEEIKRLASMKELLQQLDTSA